MHGAIFYRDAASGALHNLVCDRQAQSCTSDFFRARGMSAEERLEDLSDQIRRNSWAVIVYDDRRL